MTLRKGSIARVELLEQRRLLSADPEPGVYRNAAGDTITVEHSVGPFYHVTTDITVFDNGTIRRRDVATFVEVFSGKNLGSVTDYHIDIPDARGNGKVTIRVPNSGGEKSAAMDGELNPEIFLPDPVTVSGVPEVTSGSQAQSIPANHAEALSLSKNPLLGTYKGTIRRTTDQSVFKLKASFSLNKKGHIAIEADFIIPDFGDVIIDTVVHPTHTGTFSVELGENALAGIFSAHLSHTGRLVSRLAVPSLSIETGSLKKHGGGSTAAAAVAATQTARALGQVRPTPSLFSSDQHHDEDLQLD